MNLAERLVVASDDRALVIESTPVSYADLRTRVGVAAGALSAQVELDDRVAVIAGNGLEFVVGYLASLWAGAVAAPLEPSAPSAELSRQLDVLRPQVVLTTAEHFARAREAAGDRVVIDVADLSASPIAPVTRTSEDLAALLFTSGTAGDPKAAMLTHGNLTANLDQAAAVAEIAIRPGDVVFGALPLFHVFGLNAVLGQALDAGGTVALIERFDPAATLATIRAERVTVVPVVPAMLAAWLEVAGSSATDVESVRLVVSGATALAEELRVAVRDAFGLEVHEGYGLTEAAPVVTSAAVDGPAVGQSVGWPLPGVDIRIVDRGGDDVLDGDTGEILVRGDNIFAGYWEEPEASARVLRDGWLHTGDLGLVRADGTLRLVDRAKDLIIVSGFNVFPGEVERALNALVEVAASAAVGVRDDRSGERVEAYVVAAPGAEIDERGAIDAVAQTLARYKVPTRLHVVAQLPRTWGGKVRRTALSS